MTRYLPQSPPAPDHGPTNAYPNDPLPTPKPARTPPTGAAPR
ncbi:hypothetical protein HMPREF1550_02218 [Actinomyces sp. oral taxon 877 str. F0543]|nr:hypothetical protein HMPREF1550_02218 [Actinomyces sp. oral taxon 877 str. F0543]